MVEYYERIGYLPRAILNALARLGWSLDDKTEIMSLETIVENFTLDRIVKAPAGFDPEKLLSFQAHWMNEVPLDRKVEMCVPYLVKAGYLNEPCDDSTRNFVAQVLTAMGDRLKIFSDVLDFAEFFVADDALVFEEKAFEKRIRKAHGAVELLTKFRQRLIESERFDAAFLESLTNAFAEAEGVKLGEIIHAIRVAVTGKATGVGMFDCLAILGRDRCAARIQRALQHV
jgi:glutamyl-tRNA synthetase